MRELETTQLDSESSVGGTPAQRAPFQFGLRAMFVGVALLSVLFAIMGIVGPVWSTFIVWFLLLLAAHVSGNVWGTRKTLRRVDDASDGGLSRPPSDVAAVADMPASCVLLGSHRGTRLRESTRLGWPMIVSTAIGIVGGGALGATLLWLSRGGADYTGADYTGADYTGADYTGVMLGSLSSAVVGGFLGFLASSFVAVGLNAWQEAARG